MQRDLVAGGKAVVGGSVGTFDDLFAGIARGNGDHRTVLTDTQRGLLLRRLARDASPFSGFAETLGATLAELESGPRRARGPRAGARGSSALVSRRARPARAVGPGSRAPLRGGTRRRRSRRLGRPPRLCVRVRGSHRGAVGARRGARGPRRRHRLAPVRARAARVHRSRADGGDTVQACRRAHRGASGRVRSLRAARARASRAAAVRRRRRAGSGARGGRALPRGAGRARRARARGRGDPRARPQRDESGRHRGRRTLAGAVARAARDGVHRARHPVRDRGPRRGSARRPSAARCSRCSASPGSGVDATTSTGSCALRTRVSVATTSTSSKDGSAGAPFTRRSAWRRRRSGCAASRCRSSTRCVRAARTRRR